MGDPMRNCVTTECVCVCACVQDFKLEASKPSFDALPYFGLIKFHPTRHFILRHMYTMMLKIIEA